MMKKYLSSLAATAALVISGCTTYGAGPQQLSKKEIAAGIIETGLIKGDVDFLNQYIAKDYIQHNPQAVDGRAGVVGFTEFLASNGAENKATIVRALEQDDLVALHVIYEFGDTKLAAFDIFRFEGNVAVEHWDGLQPWVEETVSGRSMTDGPTTIVDLDKTEDNRALAVDFINEVLINGKTERITDYLDPIYLQHNPNVDDGLEALGAFIGNLQEQGISFGYTKIHNVVAEGDFVLTQNEGDFGGAPTVFYDLFRIENGKIIEHWDVIQEIPAEMAHDNGMF